MSIKQAIACKESCQSAGTCQAVGSRLESLQTPLFFTIIKTNNNRKKEGVKKRTENILGVYPLDSNSGGVGGGGGLLPQNGIRLFIYDSR